MYDIMNYILAYRKNACKKVPRKMYDIMNYILVYRKMHEV